MKHSLVGWKDARAITENAWEDYIAWKRCKQAGCRVLNAVRALEDSGALKAEEVLKEKSGAATGLKSSRSLPNFRCSGGKDSSDHPKCLSLVVDSQMAKGWFDEASGEMGLEFHEAGFFSLSPVAVCLAFFSGLVLRQPLQVRWVVRHAKAAFARRPLREMFGGKHPYHKPCALKTVRAMAVELQYLYFALPQLPQRQPRTPGYSWEELRNIDPAEADRRWLEDVEAIHRQARRYHRKAQRFWEGLCEAVEAFTTTASEDCRLLCIYVLFWIIMYAEFAIPPLPAEINVTNYLGEEKVPSAAQWNQQFMRKKRAAPPRPRLQERRIRGLQDSGWS
eukprot:s1825_g5.t1